MKYSLIFSSVGLDVPFFLRFFFLFFFLVLDSFCIRRYFLISALHQWCLCVIASTGDTFIPFHFWLRAYRNHISCSSFRSLWNFRSYAIFSCVHARLYVCMQLNNNFKIFFLRSFFLSFCNFYFAFGLVWLLFLFALCEQCTNSK